MKLDLVCALTVKNRQTYSDRQKDTQILILERGCWRSFGLITVEEVCHCLPKYSVSAKTSSTKLLRAGLGKIPVTVYLCFWANPTESSLFCWCAT